MDQHWSAAGRDTCAAADELDAVRPASVIPGRKVSHGSFGRIHCPNGPWWVRPIRALTTPAGRRPANRKWRPSSWQPSCSGLGWDIRCAGKPGRQTFATVGFVRQGYVMSGPNASVGLSLPGITPGAYPLAECQLPACRIGHALGSCAEGAAGSVAMGLRRHGKTGIWPASRGEGARSCLA
jgi:hypothetical protein